MQSAATTRPKALSLAPRPALGNIPIMENQIEKKMENEMEAGLYRGYSLLNKLIHPKPHSTNGFEFGLKAFSRANHSGFMLLGGVLLLSQ